MLNHTPKNILVAPLDWGAGHTTRCIPLMRHILDAGHRVIFAGNDRQQAIINSEMGDDAVTMVHLEGYNITYSPLNRIAQAGLLLQAPSVMAAIRNEQQWLRAAVKQYQIDGIVSDNRYGLYHSSVPSVIITHQLRVLSGMGRLPDNIVQRLHYRWLSRFGAVWVPDMPGADNLAGQLSRPAVLPPGTHYLGLLSRFSGMVLPEKDTDPDRLLVLLSGPEPQRTILSQILWPQVAAYHGPVVFAEGSDSAAAPAVIPPHVCWHKRLSGTALATEISCAGMVICRSGYSTLMDLGVFDARAILIPTPGQTEQEYLGRIMQQQGHYYCTPQSGFSLEQSLKKAQGLKDASGPERRVFDIHKEVVSQWLTTL